MQVSSMVALGSSFAAGPGLRPYADRRAGRSLRNYAHIAAQRLGASLDDRTVSGATTETLLRRPQRVLGHHYPPQCDDLPSGCDLVTVTAGGNDVGYIGTATRLGWTAAVGRATRGRIHPKPPASVSSVDGAERVATGLIDIVTQVRHGCPRAQIVLVDYLPVVAEPLTPARSIWREEDLPVLRSLADSVRDGFQQAANQLDVPLLAASRLGRGHEAGTRGPWVRSPAPRETGLDGAPCHPTGAGMRAVADGLVDLVLML